MDDYLAKPIRARELYATIARNAPSNPVGPEAISETPPHSAAPPPDRGTASMTTDSPVYDRKTALRNVDGSEDILLSLIEVFGEEAAEMRDKIAFALRNQDIALLQRAAHTLKSSCAALGAEPSRRAAEQLEFAARDSRLETAPNLAAQLDIELDRLAEALAGSA